MTSTCSNGRVAVVTGANKGIGFYIALQMAVSGLFEHVILGCRDATRGQSAVQQLMGLGGIKSNIRYMPLVVGDRASHSKFRDLIEGEFGKLDVLVNNAGFAFKGRDPTPFEKQTGPTLDINFRGTVDLTSELLPLLKKGQDPRLVNVASMSGHLSQLRSSGLQEQFTSSSLTLTKLHALVDKFESDVQKGIHKQEGWGNSNYGLSKLALIAATKVYARENPDVKVNCCCPGYCITDMTSRRGHQTAEVGAQTCSLPALMENPPSGEFFREMAVASW
eukprot:CAMPEP_0118725866 /NCGR_PEP_ID=MMETSP0800-20121206/33379_1 /TAXON_ID=210618 ORGANISM="Striatella unipunctata, Strain CCMP2910" /NCGR_SAMPLE_ID=MMETSP0800 /ASSEMBLY_ACC=CAM_ASM_000638 /LENGTH=276 /DNA_ID=CAMNT_0006634615 /DNA_START=49 /DNA_END=879 /DNA_ORIENTATION=-